MTASTAPHWITVTNRSLLCRPSHWSTSRMCPVDEIGRNSVIPSTIPSTTTASQSGTRVVRRKIQANDKLQMVENQQNRVITDVSTFMTMQLKITKVGNSLGILLPKEAANRLNVEAGDSEIGRAS